ncbi:MAG: thrombospondin type 3 repeat-containing protein [Thermomicrobiales bacterium]
MTRAAATLRWLALAAILIGLFSPITTSHTIAQDQSAIEAAAEGTPTPPDADGDGVADDVDNCPNVANADQADADGDGVGDACAPAPPPPDADGDGVSDDLDNCPTVANTEQANTYGDAAGDACEAPLPPPDADGDGVADAVDNCPTVANADQANRDGNGLGDACEPIVEVPTEIATDAPADIATEEATSTPTEPTSKHNVTTQLLQAPSADFAASNNFQAAAPGTYDPATGANAGGSFADSRPELESEDLTCGQAIVFYDGIEVTAGSGDYGIDFEFSSESTNHILIGFGAFLGTDLLVGDPFNANLDGNEAAIGSASIDSDSVNVHVDVTNLEAGEKVVLRVIVQLICREDLAGRQGNVQSRLGSGGGAQTIPLKLVGATPPAPPAISVVKNCPTGSTNEPGATIIYQIDITNTGLQTVYLKSDGLVDARTGAFHADAAGTTALTYPIQISPDQTVSVYFKTTVTAADITNANVDNSVTVTAVSDPTLQSALTIAQTATATCPITAPVLSIAKTPDAASVNAGSTIGFTISVTNNGPGTATVVTLTDTLPTNADLNWSLSPPVAGCSIASGELTCAFGNLAQGASASGHISSPTTVDTCGTVDNTASVSSTNAATQTASASIAVHCPAIDIVKTATDGTAEITTANVGDTITYTYTVTNTGDVDLTNVKVVDDNGTPGDTSDDVTCTIGNLAAGATDTSCTLAHLVGAQDASAGTIHNIAVVTGSAGATTVTDNDDATVAITAPDAAVTKTADADEVTVGDTLGFTIAVSNSGDGVAHDVVLDDALAGGLTWIEDPDNAACEIAANLLHCAIGDLAPGDPPFAVHVSATSTDEFCKGIENTATVTAGNEPEALVDNNEGTAFVEIDCPAIKIVKTATDGTNEITTVNMGATITYTYAVSNTGDVDLHNVSVADDNGTPGNTSDDVTCTIGALAVGATDSATCTLAHVVTLADVVAGSITNIAVATGTAPLGTTVRADDDATVTINAHPHLTITVDCPVIDGVGHIGDEVIFTIHILDDGDTPVGGLAPTSGLTGAFSTPLDLDPGESEDITFTTHITAAQALAGLFTFDVHLSGLFKAITVSADGGQECAFTPLVTVKVTKTADDAAVTAPEPIGFTIEVTNDGESTATDVTLNDPLPQGDILTWTEDLDNPDCAVVSGLLTCDFGDLAPADVRTVHVTAASDKEHCAELTNVVTIAATNETPGDEADDTASAETEVKCPDMTVNADPDGPVVTSGEPVGFTISGENIGAGTAKDATLTAPLPHGLTWTIDGPPTLTSSVNEGPSVFSAQSVAAAQVTCTPNGDGTLISCDFADLAPGMAISFHVSAQSDPEFCGQLETSPTVAATNEPSTRLANNGDFASLITVACPQVSMTKVADAGSVDPGETIGFTVTVSNEVGQGVANGVTLDDPLPANPGLSWTIDGGSAAGLCQISGGDLTCDYGAFDDGESQDVHISSPTTGATCGTVINTATVNAINEQDDQLADNEASDQVDVDCAPAILIDKIATDGTTEITTVNPGDTITYVFTVTNAGNVLLSDLVVVDDNLTPNDTTDDITLANCTATALAPGAAMTCSLPHVVTEEDGDSLTNVALVTGHDEVNSPVSDEDDATVAVDTPDEPIEELPNTGSGAVAGMSATSWLLIICLVMILSGAAYGARRRAA